MVAFVRTPGKESLPQNDEVTTCTPPDGRARIFARTRVHACRARPPKEALVLS